MTDLTKPYIEFRVQVNKKGALYDVHTVGEELDVVYHKALLTEVDMLRNELMGVLTEQETKRKRGKKNV